MSRCDKCGTSTHKNKIKVGDKFGCLTVVSYAGMMDFSSEERPSWRVRCKCGMEGIKANRNITRPSWKYCGPDCGLRSGKIN